jgi:RNA ligase (TIGR02306 family)
MSTYTCEVVPVVLEPHPDAEFLSIVRVWGYTVVVKTADWEGVDRGVYIPPDSICPNSDRFSWLYQDHMQSSKLPGRIRVRKFRGVYSQGLLMPAPSHINGRNIEIGDDLAEEWGITHYEPPIEIKTDGNNVEIKTDGNNVPGPPGMVIPVYDVENYNRYPEAIPEGTEVYITEKIHGCNARFVYDPDSGIELPDGGGLSGEIFVGSRRYWKQESKTDLWWRALWANPWVYEWCRANPRKVLYAEVFGQVQDLRYGTGQNELKVLAFDVLEQGQFVPYSRLYELLPPVCRVPVLYVGPFNIEMARKYAEGNSSIPGAPHCREGVVICTVDEQTDVKIGRCQLKIVGNRYLERGK